MTRALRRLLCFLPWFGCLLTLAQAAPPNVVFIITDQLAADALSARMGDHYLKTPAMDSLVARGTFFTRAYAANPLCVPSRAAMFSGRYPHETGVTDNTALILDAAKFPSMGTYFRSAGYATAYYGKWHLSYDPAATDKHGFETLDRQQLDTVTADNAIGFLGRKHDKPFLLVTSFLNPHNICEVPRGQELSNGPIGEPPAAEALPPGPTNGAYPRDEPDSMTRMRKGFHASRLFPVGNFSPLQWQAYRWSYYRLIEKVDAEIGRVLAALRAAGLEQNTVIVLVSDHGECAGAHGFNQKTVLYEESARVPLIVCSPGDNAARTNDRFVNTGVELLPTLLDFAGVAQPAALPGRSLRPMLRGETVADWPEEVVVQNDMTQAGIVDGSVPMTPGRMIRTDRYKYCVYAYGDQRESLVDLVEDPGELNDLARDPAFRPVLLEMRERLRRFGERHRDPLVATMLVEGPRPFPHVAQPKRVPNLKGAPAEEKR